MISTTTLERGSHYHKRKGEIKGKLMVEELNKEKERIKTLIGKNEEIEDYLRKGMLPFAFEINFNGVKLLMEEYDIKVMKRYAEIFIDIIKESISVEEITNKINKRGLFYEEIRKEEVIRLLEDKDLFLYAVHRDYELLEKLDELGIDIPVFYQENGFSFTGGKINAFHYVINGKVEKETIDTIKFLVKKGLNPYSAIFSNNYFTTKIHEYREDLSKFLEPYREIFSKAYKISIERRRESKIMRKEHVGGGIGLIQYEETIEVRVNPQRFAEELNKWNEIKGNIIKNKYDKTKASIILDDRFILEEF